MSNIRVVWGRRVAIGPDGGDTVRTLIQKFGSAKKAAEFACDIIFVLEGPSVSNAWSDKFFVVGHDKPMVEHMNATRDEWVRVEWEPRPGTRRG